MRVTASNHIIKNVSVGLLENWHLCPMERNVLEVRGMRTIMLNILRFTLTKAVVYNRHHNSLCNCAKLSSVVGQMKQNLTISSEVTNAHF
jgi:hypothetical protein